MTDRLSPEMVSGKPVLGGRCEDCAKLQAELDAVRAERDKVQLLYDLLKATVGDVF